MSCGVGCRCGADPVLLWLWCRRAAVAPIGPLAWEPPCAAGAALKSKKQTINELKSLKSLQVTDLERVWRKGNPSPPVVGMQTGAVTVENGMEVP